MTTSAPWVSYRDRDNTARCPVCTRWHQLRDDGRLRKHRGCPGSNAPAPDGITVGDWNVGVRPQMRQDNRVDGQTWVGGWDQAVAPAQKAHPPRARPTPWPRQQG